MSKIDVSKCKHYKNKNCIADYLLTDMPFSEAKCELSPNCYFRQLQQLKAEREELCTAIRNELSEQYDKRVNEAQSDIEWGILDRNATESEFCKHVIYETRNYITKLKADNEELRSDNSILLAQADAGAFTISNLNFKIQKLQQCLDEIEQICKPICKIPDRSCGVKNVYEDSEDLVPQIMQKIKEVKNND